jgi:nucleotide-binding universal stress UspA family protein
MRKALVVTNASNGVDRITLEAGELAAGVNASIVLLHITSNSEYEEERRAMQGVDAIEGGNYDVSQASEGARQFAQDIGDQVLRNIDVEYEAVGAVGDEYEQIMQTARDYSCDHIFVAGRKRSPSGKALFGDVAQKVILNFDDPVTVLTRD